MPSKPDRKIHTLKAEKAKAQRKLKRQGVALSAAQKRKQRNLRKYSETGNEKHAKRADRAERLAHDIRRRRAKLKGVLLHIVERLRFWRNRREKLENRRPDFNGHPPLQNKSIRAFVVRANKRGGYVTATSDGTHSSTSWHYKLKAVDVGWVYAEWGVMEDFQEDEYRRGLNDPSVYELFGPDNTANLKYGQGVGLSEGSSLEEAHDNHVHYAHG